MKKTPCEQRIWEQLPLIRKMMACCMIHEQGLSQKDAAEKLGLTPAAVCQYECDKRGRDKITDEKFKKEIRYSVEKILHGSEDAVGYEICRLCKYITEHGLMPL